MNHIALYGAVIAYALLSSPTPDVITWVEITVMGLLVFAIGIYKPLFALTDTSMPAMMHYHKIFLAFMIVVPTLVGFLNGYELPAILRDFAPVAALILPLCFYRQDMPLLPLIMAVAGGLFALRYLAPLVPELQFLATDDALIYLANSPLVPFAAIMGFHWFSDTEKSSVLQRVFGIVLCLICLAAMAIMLQRAPFILSVLACIGILGVRTLQKPIQSMVLGTAIIMVLIPVLPMVIDVIQSLQSKTVAVGMNNRIEEFQAVMTQTTWFGHGWGAEFKSPAVADIPVRFTHNIISYYWFKAGIIGAILSAIFVGVWMWENIKIIRMNTAIGLAIFVPMAVHVTLYTGFKTLDFALLLTLMTILRLRPAAGTV